MKKITFSHASPGPDDLRYVSEAVAGGDLAGDGVFTKRCHRLLEEGLGVRKALLTTSGAGALELAGLLLRLEPGDEVIFPAFASSMTVSPFLLRGVKPVFVDVRPDTLNIDEKLVEERINPRTRAIVLVHYAGVACEMDAIVPLAKRHGIFVVEDNAYGLFGTYRGRATGSFGVLATQSFHQTMSISCGEGGALLINDPYFVSRAETLRGAEDRGTWDEITTRFIPSEIIAAYLFGQLEARNVLMAKRRRVWETYAAALGAPSIPRHCGHVPSMFYWIAPSADAVRALIHEGLSCAPHFPALHLTPLGRRFGGRPGSCPVAEQTAATLVRLPFHAQLTEDEVAEVIEAVRSVSSVRKAG